MKKVLICLVVISMYLLGLTGTGTAGTGGPGPTPACSNLPAPTAGKILTGVFTAAYDTDQCAVDNEKCKGIEIHVVVSGTTKKRVGSEILTKTVQHLYSFSTTLYPPSTSSSPPPTPIDLCDPSLDNATLKSRFEKMPCTFGVGNDFGLQGVPVVTDVKITKRDFCNDAKKKMMTGTISIRVVPSPASP